MLKPKTTHHLRYWYSRLKAGILRFGRISSAAVFALVLVLALSASILYTRVGTQERVSAAVPATLNFQARLLQANGAIVPDGYYNVEFKLYDAASGGNNVWTETWFDSNGATAGNDNRIQVKGGYLSVYLGDQTAFGAIDWTQQYWLTMNVGGTTHSATPTWDGEMSPRLRLTSVPYAQASADSDRLDGIDSTGFAQLAPSAIQGVNSANSALRLNQTGTGDLLQLQSGGADILTLSNSGVLTVTGMANFNGGLTVASGQQLTNSGSTLMTAISIADRPSGGAIGTAAATVDSASTFNVNQTTTGQTLTLPTPTSLTAGRIVFVANVGTADFAMHGVTITNAKAQSYIWNGSEWVSTSIDGSGNGATSIGTLDGATKSADGGVITANQLFFQTADATYPGLVSTGSQTFAGAKTFNGQIVAGAGIDIGSQTLQGTTAIISFTNFSVDASGNVATAGNLAVNGGNITSDTSLSLTANNGALTLISTGVGNNIVLNSAGSIELQDNTNITGTLIASGLATMNGGLTVSSGQNFVNSGSTLFSSINISDLATGGNIGTAAATVDVATTFDVNQTTAGQTLTLPAPTLATSGRVAFVNNIGTVSFSMYNSVIAVGQSNTFIWNGSNWVTTVSLSGTVVSQIGTIDSQTKSADGAVITGNALFMQTADATNPGLVSTGSQTFAGAKTFNGQIVAGAGIDLGTQTLQGTTAVIDFTNFDVDASGNTDIAGTLSVGTADAFQVSSSGAVTAVGINSGTGLIQGTGGLTVTGATSINATGTGNTAIGNATGTFQVTSSGVNITTAGAISGVSTLNTSGIVTVGTLGTADTDTVVCRNASGQLAACNSTFATSAQFNAAFVQGGNSFGADAVLGTNDAYSLAFETAGITRLTIDTSGNATLTGNLTVSGTGTSSFAGALTVAGNTTLGDASTDTLTLTGTSVLIPNNLNFDNNTLFIDAANNRVGIGTTTPTAQLQVVGADGASSSINVRTYGAIPVISTSRANGTAALPTALGSGDNFAQFSGEGYDGTAFTGTRAAITLTSSQSWTTTAQGSNINFFTTANDTTSLQQRAVITNSGQFGLGTINPTATFGGTGRVLQVENTGGVAEIKAVASAGSAAIFSLQVAGPTTDWHFENSAGTYRIVETGVATRFSITPGGNVGIGTSGNPAALFSIGGVTGNFQVNAAGAVTAVGVNSGTGLIQGTGGLTVTGAASINTTGTANTAIGNATGTFQVTSSGVNITTAGAISGVSTLNTSGIVTVGALGTASNDTVVCRNGTGQLAACNSTFATSTDLQGYVRFAPATAQADNSANPSIFINDTGGGNLLQLQSGGTNRFVVDNNGNVTSAGSGSFATGLTVVADGLNVTGNSTIAGTLTGLTGLTSSGTITFSGLTPDRLVATTTGGQLTTSITSANLASSITDETGTGVIVFGTSPTITTSLLTGSTSFDLLNTTATTINAFGAATTLNIGAVTGTTTVNNNLDVQGTLTVGTANAFVVNASGAITAVTGITTTGGYTQSGTGVNTFTGNTNFSGTANFTNSANLAFTSATAFRVQNTGAADTMFTVDTAARGVGGGNLIKIGNSTGTDGDVTILQVDSSTADITSNLSALNGGLYYNSTSNTLKTIVNGAVDEICTLTAGNCAGAGSSVTQSGTNVNGQVAFFTSGNNITSSSNFLFDGTNVTIGGTLTVGTSGALTIAANGDITTAGDLAVNGGDITSTGALNITPGGALTVGSTTQTTTIQGTVTTITSNGAGNDIILSSADAIELQGATNITGSLTVSVNADIAGTLFVGTGDAFQVDATGNITTSGDLAVNGGDITSTGALNITPGGTLTAGATGHASILQGSTVSITSNGVGNDITLTSADQIILNAGSTIELQDNTNITGDFTVSGNSDVAGYLYVGSADQFQVDATGNITTSGDLAVNGGDITSTGALNITPGGALAVGSAAHASTFQGSTVSITSTGAGNDITMTSADQIILNAVTSIELQNNTNITGNLDVSGTLSVGSTDQFQVSSGGTLTFAGVATDITTGTNEDLTVVANGTGIINLDDIVRIGSLATADTDAVVCRNTAGQLATCNNTFLTASALDNVFVQGGNSFGATAVLGTNDAQMLHFKTNNIVRLEVQTNGNIAFNTNTLFVDAVNNRVGIGDTTPAYALTVGSGDVSGIDSSGNIIVKGNGAAATGDLSFGTGANRIINVLAQTTANAAGNNLTLQAATGNGTGTGGSLQLTAGIGGGSSGVGGDVLIQGGAAGAGGTTSGSVIVRSNGNNKTTAFVVQNASSSPVFTVDTVNTRITVGTGSGSVLSNRNLDVAVAEISNQLHVGGATNYIQTNASTGQLRFAGTARNSKTISLMPEFPGAVLTGDGTNNTGTMTSDFCINRTTSPALQVNVSGSNCGVDESRNYYQWTAQATNDYDVWVRWQVPSDFDGWAATNPIQFYGWRSSSSTGTSVTMTIYNENGVVCGTATPITNTTTWAVTNYNSSGCSTAAGNTLFIRISLSVGVNNEFARIGEIKLNYMSNF